MHLKQQREHIKIQTTAVGNIQMGRSKLERKDDRGSQVITIEFSFRITPSVRGQSLVCLYRHLTKLDALQLV